MSDTHQQQQADTESIAELGDISKVLSSRSAKGKHPLRPCFERSEDAENMSTEFNSDRPGLSAVDGSVSKKTPVSFQLKELTSAKRSTAANQIDPKIKLPLPTPHERKFSERSLAAELTNLMALLQSIEQQQQNMELSFQQAAADLLEELHSRRQRNKNMNVELIRMRRQLACRRRELTAAIRAIQSKAKVAASYHVQELVLPIGRHNGSFRSQERPQSSSPSPASPLKSQEKPLKPLIAQMPSFKNRCATKQVVRS